MYYIYFDADSIIAVESNSEMNADKILKKRKDIKIEECILLNIVDKKRFKRILSFLKNKIEIIKEVK